MTRALLTTLAAALGVAILGVPWLVLGFFFDAPGLRQWCMRTWGRIIVAVAGVRLTVAGAEHLSVDKSLFFVGNHQSALDIPILCATLPKRVCFMAKDSLFRIPFFGRVIRDFGHIPINRSRTRVALEAVDNMIENLRRTPSSVVVFPEGTRSPTGGLLPFRRGAMKICQRAGQDVVAFSISGSRAVHRRGVFRVRPGPVRVTFNKPISADEAAAMASTELHDRLRAAVSAGLESSARAACPDETTTTFVEGT